MTCILSRQVPIKVAQWLDIYPGINLYTWEHFKMSKPKRMSETLKVMSEYSSVLCQLLPFWRLSGEPQP